MTRRRRMILASQSPRRRQLLAEAGYEFDVIPPSPLAEDGVSSGAEPKVLVAQLAWQKAADVARRVPQGLVIGCDTIAVCEGQILGKPEDRRHARQMLELLRGKVHQVYSGLCLWRRPDDTTRTEVDVTTLKMGPIAEYDLEEYLDSGAWYEKAGAFGYQDRLGWLRIVAGSESNVVGLPMELLAKMLKDFDT